jgi:glycosyltransferase involved in cell wall biosynthesis
MRIGVNTRLFVEGKMDGIAWFAYEILKRMVVAHPEHEFVFFFDRKYNPVFIFADNVKPVVVHPSARHPLLWILFFEFGIRRALVREKIDVFFSPDGWLCLGSDIKTLTVIHDLNFVHHPAFTSFWVSRYYRFFFPRFARRADALATVSEFSKRDIVEQYTIASNKITVAYNGASNDFFEILEAEKQHIRSQYTDSLPFFIFVGTASMRKNIINILWAFDAFRAKGYRAKLVFVGMNKYWNKKMKDVFRRLVFADDIVFTGYVTTSELNRFISASAALLYPSFFEGFGVPIVEAFACATPVITSDRTAMPEVAGDAALLVNPFSVDEIAQTMEALFTDSSLRKSLIEKGKQRLSLFQWTKSADDLWNVIEHLFV